MYVDTLNFAASCIKCLPAKHHSTPAPPLQPTYTLRYPDHRISTDLVDIEFYPLTDTSAPKVMKCLFSYITTFGRP